jgi:N-formylglutamate deformylase
MPIQLLGPQPGSPSIPVILDSPHSGTVYPDDFGHTIDFAALREAEDTHVDLIYSDAPALGAAMLCAQFPRSYVDCNRDAHDIDPVLFGMSHDPDQLTSKVRLGKGVIWRCLDDGTPIYSSVLPEDHAESRISRYYQPYWDALRAMVTAAKERHSVIVHINCHSMPSVAGRFATEKPGLVHPDVVLGNRDGSTCSAELLAVLKAVCDEFKMNATLNDPYKGVAIVRDVGQPSQGIHSVQVEINRRLYMDEVSRELHQGFDRVKSFANALVQASARFAIAESQSPKTKPSLS